MDTFARSPQRRNMADPLENQEDLAQQFTPEDTKRADVISGLETPEEIKAARELFNENLQKEKEAPVAEPTPKVETPAPAAPEVTPPAETPPPAAETVIPPKFVLSDEVINSFPEEDRNVLAKYKDKSEADILKALVHSQRLIGKKAEPQPDVVENIFKTQQPAQKQTIDENVVNKLVVSELRRQFSDFPEDKDQQDEYITELSHRNFAQAQKLHGQRESLSGNFTDFYTKASTLKENYGSINSQITASEIEQIKEIAKTKYKVENLSELGINLDLDANGRNPLINELLMKSDKSGLDPEILRGDLMQFYGLEIPILKQGALRAKFFENFSDKIFEAAIQKARKEGYESRAKKPIEPTTPQSSAHKIIDDGNITDTQIAEMSNMDDIKAAKAKLATKLFNS